MYHSTQIVTNEIVAQILYNIKNMMQQEGTLSTEQIEYNIPFEFLLNEQEQYAKLHSVLSRFISNYFSSLLQENQYNFELKYQPDLYLEPILIDENEIHWESILNTNYCEEGIRWNGTFEQFKNWLTKLSTDHGFIDNSCPEDLYPYFQYIQTVIVGVKENKYSKRFSIFTFYLFLSFSTDIRILPTYISVHERLYSIYLALVGNNSAKFENSDAKTIFKNGIVRSEAKAKDDRKANSIYLTGLIYKQILSEFSNFLRIGNPTNYPNENNNLMLKHIQSRFENFKRDFK